MIFDNLDFKRPWCLITIEQHTVQTPTNPPPAEEYAVSFRGSEIASGGIQVRGLTREQADLIRRHIQNQWEGALLSFEAYMLRYLEQRKQDIQGPIRSGANQQEY